MLFSYLPYLPALPLLAFASPSPSYLPPCNQIDRPCKCPHGTTFKNLTSFGVIGAPAFEVQNIMDYFFQLEWLGGITPSSTTGKDRDVGATRTFNFTGPNGPAGGYYQISEVLFKNKIDPDGSFVQGFAQTAEPPSVQVPHGGSYHGEWALLIAQQTVIANETAVAWKNWRCEIGTTFPAASAHEGGIANTSAILLKEGKKTGVDVEPFTIFYEVRDD